MSPGKSYGFAMAGLVAAALVIIAAFALPWANATVPLLTGLDGSRTQIAVAGRELFAGAAAMGWLGLAAVAAILATRGWGRMLIGVLVVGFGLVVVVSAISFGADPAQVISDELSRRYENEVPAQWTSTSWWLLGLTGGLGMVAVGGVLVARGRSWPGFSRRYERAPGADAAGAPGPLSALTAWDALDRGEDPTT